MSEPVASTVLLGTTVTVAAVHTLIGIDHTLPFVVLGRARGFGLRKVLAVTALCGLGHVLSSVLLGLVGIALGAALERMQWLQALRGSVAAWLLIAFGTFFAVRAVVRSLRKREHSHAHSHEDGTVHCHEHAHDDPAHIHPHAAAQRSGAAVFALFVIFVLGPCEPLIPLMLAPASLHDWTTVVTVCAAFSAVTIFAMLAVVTAAYLGLSRFTLPAAAGHGDLLAGLSIAASGIAIQTLGI